MCEKYIDQLPLARPQPGDLARNPGMCPDWESNRQPFGLQTGTQSTKPHQPGSGWLEVLTLSPILPTPHTHLWELPVCSLYL